VKSKVEKIKKNREKRQIKNEDKEVIRKKKEQSAEFTKQIKRVIYLFETQFFSLRSSEDTVAEFIVNGGRGKLGWKDDPFSFIEFTTYSNDKGHTNIKKSSIFKEWKEKLENKFGIDIIIEKEYEEHKQFGNSGYAQPSGYSYSGLIATVNLKGEL